MPGRGIVWGTSRVARRPLAENWKTTLFGEFVQLLLHAPLDVVIAGPNHRRIACVEIAELLMEIDRFADVDNYLGRQRDMAQKVARRYAPWRARDHGQRLDAQSIQLQGASDTFAVADDQRGFMAAN